MDQHQSHGMREAMRLVQAGKLHDATALLQGLLGGRSGRHASPGGADDAGSASDRGRPTIEGTAETIEVGEARRTTAAETPRGRAEPTVPDRLRRFVDRIRRGLGEKPSSDRASDLARPRGRFVAGSFTCPAGTRAYKLYIPSGHHGQPVPLVVMLHGCTQSPDDFAAGTRMNTLAEPETCLVVYPAQPASANASKCWNWFEPKDQRRGGGEPSLIAGITRQVMREHTVDPRRVYVAGLSAGGAKAAIMGQTYPDLYAAVSVHSGLACGAAKDVTTAFAAMRQGAPAGARAVSGTGSRSTPPTIVFHGDQDGTVHRRNGEQVIAQASPPAVGLSTVAEEGEAPGGRRYTRTRRVEANGRTVSEHWLIHGAGHAWSGGSPAGSYTDPKGPDASREMLRFFLGHAHEASSQA